MPSLLRGLRLLKGYVHEFAGAGWWQAPHDGACAALALEIGGFSGSSARADDRRGPGGVPPGPPWPGPLRLWTFLSSGLRLRRQLIGRWRLRRISVLRRSRLSPRGAVSPGVRGNHPVSLLRRTWISQLRLSPTSTAASARLPSNGRSSRSTINAEPGYSGSYGPFTGHLPIPKRIFAPYVAAASATGIQHAEPIPSLAARDLIRRTLLQPAESCKSPHLAVR